MLTARPLPARHDYLRQLAYALAAAVLIGLLVSSGTALAQSANNGRVLYNTPFVSGQLSCSAGACHGPDPLQSQNRIQNGDTAGGIALAITTVVQMAFLRGQVNSAQLQDLAAYIANPTSATGSPVLVVSPPSLTFGTTAVGATSAAQQIVLRNTGTGTLSIALVTSSSGEFVATPNCLSVPAGGSCAVNVTFTPATTGSRTATITISHNAAGVTTQVPVAGGGGAASVLAQPVLVTFGGTAVGNTSPTETVILGNAGNAPVQITSIQLTPTPSPFQISGGTCLTTATLQAQAVCSLVLRFAPTGLGAVQGQVVVSYNALPGATAIGLAGSGVALQSETRYMVEFQYAPLNYYFITSREADKAALDVSPGWARTGQSFPVYSAPANGRNAITRYYFDRIARAQTRGSHFYTLVDSEKAALDALNPTNVQAPQRPFNEGPDSYAFLPLVEGVGGSCAAGLTPVYRLFRGNAKFPDDPNHRFTTSTTIYNEFVAQGWDDEGVKFCVPAP